MEAIGECASGSAARAAMPGRRTSSLRSVPGLGAPSPASLPGAPAVADTSASDGGAAAGISVTDAPVTESAFTDTTLSGGASDCLERCLVLLEAAVESAPGELALAGFRDAADFAGRAEEISRRVEHVQLLAAAAVDRTRTEAINAAGPASKAAGWTTGWGNGPDDGTVVTKTAYSAAGLNSDGAAVRTVAGTSATSSSAAASASGPAASTYAPALSPADDGSRNTAEFLRTRLRISAAEARRRLALANAVLPRTGITGQLLPCLLYTSDAADE